MALTFTVRILECSDLLEKFGGHKYAAGLTLDINNLELFQRKFEEVVSSTITEEMLTPVIDIDTPIALRCYIRQVYAVC